MFVVLQFVCHADNKSSAIFMSDTPNQIKNKINKHAFSGGKDTAEEQRKFGGNPDVDVSYQCTFAVSSRESALTGPDLSYFEDDDAKLEQVANDYREGKLLTGELKQMAIKLLQEYVKDFQERRSKVTDEVLRQYTKPRELEWKGNPNPKPKESKKEKEKKEEQSKS